MPDHRVDRIDPKLSPRVVDFVAGRPKFSLLDVVPEQAFCQRFAAAHAMRMGEEDETLRVRFRPFLTQSVSRFECDLVPTNKERSYCYQLLASLHFYLGDQTEGLAAVRKSTEVLPADYAARIVLIQRLRENGMLDEALIEATEGRSLFPTNSRFNTLIEIITNEQLRAADEAIRQSPNLSIPGQDA